MEPECIVTPPPPPPPQGKKLKGHFLYPKFENEFLPPPPNVLPW